MEARIGTQRTRGIGDRAEVARSRSPGRATGGRCPTEASAATRCDRGVDRSSRHRDELDRHALRAHPRRQLHDGRGRAGSASRPAREAAPSRHDQQAFLPRPVRTDAGAVGGGDGPQPLRRVALESVLRPSRHGRAHQPARPPGDDLLERIPGIHQPAEPEGGAPALPPADRSGMGVRGSRRHDHGLLLR